jgi:NAD(P)-dependent dehydrogenase (short-subunit alcohol dehydrogenase family)
MAGTPPIEPPPAMFSPELLAGRKALVTGGGTGIGYGIAHTLVRAGAEVVIAARRRDRLEAAAEELRAATGATVGLDEVDIRNLDTVAGLVERHRDMDILVNNAGGHFAQKARDFSPNGWRTVVDLNLHGTWNMTQAFGRAMLEGDGGSICHIVMTVGRGMPGLAHSAAARAGVVELTRTLSWEWGPRVRLNCVAPGQIRTAAWDTTYAPGVGSGVADQPLGFEGTVFDIGNAVAFLVSPAAAFITGQLLYVDGGLINVGHQNALPDGSYPERDQPPSRR